MSGVKKMTAIVIVIVIDGMTIAMIGGRKTTVMIAVETKIGTIVVIAETSATTSARIKMTIVEMTAMIGARIVMTIAATRSAEIEMMIVETIETKSVANGMMIAVTEQGSLNARRGATGNETKIDAIE